MLTKFTSELHITLDDDGNHSFGSRQFSSRNCDFCSQFQHWPITFL